jgi:hypothetical protein
MIQYKTMRLTTDPMVDSTMKTKGPSESDIADLLSLVSLALLAAVCQPGKSPARIGVDLVAEFLA